MAICIWLRSEKRTLQFASDECSTGSVLSDRATGQDDRT